MRDSSEIVFVMAVTVLAIGLGREVATFLFKLGTAVRRASWIGFRIAAALLFQASSPCVRPLLIPVSNAGCSTPPVPVPPISSSPLPATNYLETMSDDELDRLLNEPEE
jgi:hypothetical protein